MPLFHLLLRGSDRPRTPSTPPSSPPSPAPASVPTTSRIVLLHGWGQTHHCWLRTSAALRDRGHDVLLVDLSGHGLSPMPGRGDNFRAMTPGAVVAALDETLTAVGWGDALEDGDDEEGQGDWDGDGNGVGDDSENNDHNHLNNDRNNAPNCNIRNRAAPPLPSRGCGRRRRLVLAGTSMGGGIAQRFAAQYPHRVDRLVLVASSGQQEPAWKPSSWLPPIVGALVDGIAAVAESVAGGASTHATAAGGSTGGGGGGGGSSSSSSSNSSSRSRVSTLQSVVDLTSCSPVPGPVSNGGGTGVGGEGLAGRTLGKMHLSRRAPTYGVAAGMPRFFLAHGIRVSLVCGQLDEMHGPHIADWVPAHPVYHIVKPLWTHSMVCTMADGLGLEALEGMWAPTEKEAAMQAAREEREARERREGRAARAAARRAREQRGQGEQRGQRGQREQSGQRDIVEQSGPEEVRPRAKL